MKSKSTQYYLDTHELRKIVSFEGLAKDTITSFLMYFSKISGEKISNYNYDSVKFLSRDEFTKSLENTFLIASNNPLIKDLFIESMLGIDKNLHIREGTTQLMVFYHFHKAIYWGLQKQDKIYESLYAKVDKIIKKSDLLPLPTVLVDIILEYHSQIVGDWEEVYSTDTNLIISSKVGLTYNRVIDKALKKISILRDDLQDISVEAEVDDGDKGFPALDQSEDWGPIGDSSDWLTTDL